MPQKLVPTIHKRKDVAPVIPKPAVHLGHIKDDYDIELDRGKLKKTKKDKALQKQRHKK
jgi:hypothetical protein